MPTLSSLFRDAVALTAIGLLSACAPYHGSLPTFGVQSQTGGSTSVRPMVGIEVTSPSCKGQKNTTDYATTEETLNTNGGALCIPSFAGFGGTINYSAVDPSVSVTLTSSVTNYDHLPSLSSGKAIFYLQFTISHASKFGRTVAPGSGLTGKRIIVGKLYTAYFNATVAGTVYKFSCYATAAKGKYGGIVGPLGNFFKGQTLFAPAKKGVMELYSGRGSIAPECSKVT